MAGRSKCSENSVVYSCPVLSHGRSKCPENGALLSSHLIVSCGHRKCPENGALPPAYRSLRFVLAGRREAQSGSTLAWFCVVIFSFFFSFKKNNFRQCLSEIIDICMIVRSFRHCVQTNFDDLGPLSASGGNQMLCSPCLPANVLME